jgi:hypothetical protein
MKGTLFITLCLIIVMAFTGVAYCDPMDELIDQFESAFEAEKPAPNSSVGADYKQAQAALGSFYTTKTLSLIYKQNQTVVEKYDQLIEKYDQIIEQNQEIIRLLGIIAKEKGEQK